LLFVLFYVLFVCKCFLQPGDNRTAVNKYININKNNCLPGKQSCPMKDEFPHQNTLTRILHKAELTRSVQWPG